MSAQARELFDAIGTQLVLTEFGGDPPRVGEEYAIEAIIGAGGFGLICRATQLALHRRVALKLYPLGGREDTGVREALREARSLARLEHPGIVAVHAAGESELITRSRLPCAFVELQFVEGQTLRRWLTDERNADEVIHVLLEAGRALAHAHDSGVVHRDFKPENLMIDREGRARVIDFGLALATEHVGAELADWSVDAGRIRGTPGYMAPEASQGLPRAASDQFAFAVVVREALTGKHPFRSAELGVDAPEGGPACFERLEPTIDRAMAPSPEDRFASMAELCDAILAALGHESPRGRWKVIAAGVLALSGAVVLAGYALDLDLLGLRDAPIRASCSADAQAVAGRWSIDWTDSEAHTGRIEVELVADGCRVRGSANAGSESTELRGEVTVAGTWLLSPSPPTSWLPAPMLLVGMNGNYPAFGADLQDPARPLRAYRRY